MTALSLDSIAVPPPTRQAMPMRNGILNVRRSIIPGFGLTLGITITMLSLVVLIPLSAVFLRAAGLG